MKGEGEARSRKNKSTREGSMTGDPGEAWVAGGDGLHGGMIGGKNGGKGTQGRVWKMFTSEAYPFLKEKIPLRSPRPPGLPPSLERVRLDFVPRLN